MRVSEGGSRRRRVQSSPDLSTRPPRLTPQIAVTATVWNIAKPSQRFPATSQAKPQAIQPSFQRETLRGGRDPEGAASAPEGAAMGTSTEADQDTGCHRCSGKDCAASGWGPGHRRRHRRAVADDDPIALGGFGHHPGHRRKVELVQVEPGSAAAWHPREARPAVLVPSPWVAGRDHTPGEGRESHRKGVIDVPARSS